MQMIFDNAVTDINTILAFIFTVIVLIFPFFVISFMLYNFQKLDQPYMHERFGSLYDSLDTKRGRGIIAYIGHYFIRRILLACAVVFSSSLFLQFALMTVTILIQISIVITVKPLKGGKFALGMEMFHEVTTMLILYTVICFSQFVPDPFTRSVMGYVSISLVSGHLLVCLGFMVTSTLLDMIEQIKNKFYQYQLSKLQKKV